MGYHRAMRYLLCILLWLATSSAWANSTIKLESKRPIVVVVNARPYPLNGQLPVDVKLKPGKEGLQNFTVRSLTGQILWSGQFLVPAHQIVTLTWDGDTLSVTGRKSVRQRVKLSMQQAPGTEPGGLASQDLTTAEDRLLDLAAQDDGPSAAQDTDGADADLEATNPSPEPAPALPPPRERTPDGTIALVPADDPSASMLNLEARNSSWGNIYLDGALIWEHRNVGLSRRIFLSAGPHTLIIKDFRDKDTWLSGTVVTTTGEPVTILFGANQPTDTLGPDGCWTPDN